MDQLLRYPQTDFEEFIDRLPIIDLLLSLEASKLNYTLLHRCFASHGTIGQLYHFSKKYPQAKELNQQSEIAASRRQELESFIQEFEEIVKLNRKRMEKGRKLDSNILEIILDFVDIISVLHVETLDFFNTILATYEILVHLTNVEVVDLEQLFLDSDVRGEQLQIRKAKRSLCQLCFRAISSTYLDLPQKGDLNETEKAIVEDKLSRLCDFLMHLIETCSIEQSHTLLIDSPLLLDLELLFKLGKEIQNTTKEYHQIDLARVEYIIKSLDHIVVFSGCADTRRMLTNSSPKDKPIQPLEDELVLLSNISMIQDLFPEYGQGFLEACLKAMNNDPETVIMKIVEQDFPEFIDKLDRNLPRQTGPPSYEDVMKQSVSLDSSNTLIKDENDKELLDSRRNIFDGDEFDVFSGPVDSSKVIFGKKEFEMDITDETLEIQKKLTLNLYDQYEDEEDDTYAVDGNLEQQDTQDPNLEYLVRIVNSNPQLFHSSSRNSKKRQEMKEKTGMSDEQLEGWYIMLMRNPQKDYILTIHEFKGNKQNNQTERVDLPTEQPKPESRKPSGRGRGRSKKVDRVKGHDKKMQKAMQL